MLTETPHSLPQRLILLSASSRLIALAVSGMTGLVSGAYSPPQSP